ncbi:MAG: OmpA family protein [Flammeovirgaceae bacterium]
MISCFLVIDASAQLKKGKRLFFKEHYRRALPVFEEVIQQEPSNAQALYYGGICHLLNYDNATGLDYMLKALALDPKIDRKHQDYWLGIAYHYNYEFDSAKKYLNAYKETLKKKDQRHETIAKWLHEVDWANKHRDVQIRYWVEKIRGNINTEHSEHSPLISQDGQTLIYTSRGHGVTGNKLAYDGDFYEDIYRVTLKNDSTWSTPEKISQILNTKSHDASCQLFDNGNQMLIYRWKSNGDLYLAQKISNNQWGDAKRLPKGTINTRHYESHGFITEDGNSLFFASNRGNIRGDLDIYVSTKDASGEWGKPEKLSDHVNSPYDDDSPFVTPDGKELYFSSRGRNSMGGFDVFRSVWDETAKAWGPAENMGEPVNTPEDDIYLVWQSNGLEGYFSSNRVAGEGEKDIYRFGKVFPVRLEGIVYSKETKLPLPNIKLDFSNKAYQVDYKSMTDEKGNYALEIASQLPFSLGFTFKLPNTPDAQSSFYKDSIFIPLAKVPGVVMKRDFYIPEPTVHIELLGTVTDRDTDTPIDGRVVVRDDKNNVTLKEVETANGNFKSGLDVVPGSTLTIDFYHGETKYEQLADVTVLTKGTIKKDISLIVNEKDEALVVTVKEGELPSNIYYDFDQDHIREDAANELDKWVTYLKEHPNAEVELLSHTDARGSEAYNLDLSRRRANAVESYLKLKGVAADRIFKKLWFGEGKLTNDCMDGSACSKAAHQANRRTEIKLKTK